MTACICRPRDPEGWYREDCPTHGREAQEWCDNCGESVALCGGCADA